VNPNRPKLSRGQKYYLALRPIRQMRQNTDKVSGLTSESLRGEMTSYRLLTPSRRLWSL